MIDKGSYVFVGGYGRRDEVAKLAAEKAKLPFISMEDFSLVDKLDGKGASEIENMMNALSTSDPKEKKIRDAYSRILEIKRKFPKLNLKSYKDFGFSTNDYNALSDNVGKVSADFYKQKIAKLFFEYLKDNLEGKCVISADTSLPLIYDERDKNNFESALNTGKYPEISQYVKEHSDDFNKYVFHDVFNGIDNKVNVKCSSKDKSVPSQSNFNLIHAEDYKKVAGQTIETDKCFENDEFDVEKISDEVSEVMKNEIAKQDEKADDSKKSKKEKKKVPFFKKFMKFVGKVLIVGFVVDAIKKNKTKKAEKRAEKKAKKEAEKKAKNSSVESVSQSEINEEKNKEKATQEQMIEEEKAKEEAEAKRKAEEEAKKKAEEQQDEEVEDAEMEQ